eukprot:10995121-Heterocapsa_arctica.AAC.1
MGGVDSPVGFRARSSASVWNTRSTSDIPSTSGIRLCSDVVAHKPKQQHDSALHFFAIVPFMGNVHLP